MSELTYAIIGGDLRCQTLAQIYIDEGKEISVIGFNKAESSVTIKESENIIQAVADKKIIIGPIPCSNDCKTINAPYYDLNIYVEDLFKSMNKDQIFIAGRIMPDILNLADKYGITAIDILQREEMAVLNAIPTAEGAIQIAIQETPITLHSSNVMILGYGRIGKILSKMLYGIGAKVHVSARRHEHIATCRSLGYKGILLEDMPKYLDKMDVIFNTVPSVLLDHEKVKLINKNCLVIDLASRPCGIDFEASKKEGLKVIWAISLPGKVARVTAANYIKETINNVITEMEVV